VKQRQSVGMDLALGLGLGSGSNQWARKRALRWALGFFVFIKFINHGGLPYLPAVVNRLTVAGRGNRCG
jgi:hypothetical protein